MIKNGCVVLPHLDIYNNQISGKCQGMERHIMIKNFGNFAKENFRSQFK
jgi:hypothetical protein